MTLTTPTVTAAPAAARTANPVRRTTIRAGLTAAAATTAVAAAAHAAGVSFDVDGQIPLAAFAQMTLLGAVIGGMIAAVLNRRSDAPRRRFVQTAAVLTALSCVPSVALPHDVATRLALVATHLVAAAIVVPALARQLHD